MCPCVADETIDWWEEAQALRPVGGVHTIVLHGEPDLMPNARLYRRPKDQLTHASTVLDLFARSSLWAPSYSFQRCYGLRTIWPTISVAPSCPVMTIFGPSILPSPDACGCLILHSTDSSDHRLLVYCACP